MNKIESLNDMDRNIERYQDEIIKLIHTHQEAYYKTVRPLFEEMGRLEMMKSPKPIMVTPDPLETLESFKKRYGI